MILCPLFVLPLIFSFAKLDGWCAAPPAPFESVMNYLIIRLAVEL